MNKGDLVQLVAKETASSKAAAEKAVNAVLGGIRKGLKKEKKVQLIGQAFDKDLVSDEVITKFF